MKKTYICAACKEEFEYGWSDEEAKKEADFLWDNNWKIAPVVICDDCFKRGITKIN